MDLDEFQQEMQNDLAQFEDEENRRQDQDGGAILPTKESVNRTQSRQSLGNQSANNANSVNMKASRQSSKKSITASAH
jgi:hypothetical protein